LKPIILLRSSLKVGRLACIAVLGILSCLNQTYEFYKFIRNPHLQDMEYTVQILTVYASTVFSYFVKTNRGEKTVMKCDLKYCILISTKRFGDINNRVY
jgi:hypothetical protein